MPKIFGSCLCGAVRAASRSPSSRQRLASRYSSCRIPITAISRPFPCRAAPGSPGRTPYNRREAEGLPGALIIKAGTLDAQPLHDLCPSSIHPDECIDCGVCVPECPVDAIKPDTDPGLEKWLSLNAEYAKIWPNITRKKALPPDSKEWEGKPDKLQYFSPNPGAGD